MKKNLLPILCCLFLSTGLFAQEDLSYVNIHETVNAPLEKPAPISNSDKEMKEELAYELKQFTNYLNQEMDYPEIAQLYNVEGKMILEIVFDGQIQKITVVKSLTPDCEKMVISKIKEYVSSWDGSKNESIPSLTLKLPIGVRLKG